MFAVYINSCWSQTVSKAGGVVSWRGDAHPAATPGTATLASLHHCYCIQQVRDLFFPLIQGECFCFMPFFSGAQVSRCKGFGWATSAGNRSQGQTGMQQGERFLEAQGQMCSLTESWPHLKREMLSQCHLLIIYSGCKVPLGYAVAL